MRLKLVILLASAPLLFYLWPSALGGDAEFVTVFGKSMLPTIPSGSLAITKKMPDYGVGDIVAFAQEEEKLSKIVVHRIVEERENGFIIRGDNNPTNDPGVIPHDMILGEVIFATPYVGYAALLMKNPIVLMLSLFLMGPLMMREKKGKAKKKEQSLFLPLVVLNLIGYSVMEISVSMGIIPKADPVAAFFYTLIKPFLAGTLAFAVWQLGTMGAYVLERKIRARSERLEMETAASSGTVVKKETISALAMIEMFLMLLVTFKMMQVMGMVSELLSNS